MPREKGTPNTPQSIIEEMMEKHRKGASVKEKAVEYERAFKSIKNMITWRTARNDGWKQD